MVHTLFRQTQRGISRLVGGSFKIKVPDPTGSQQLQIFEISRSGIRDVTPATRGQKRLAAAEELVFELLHIGNADVVVEDSAEGRAVARAIIAGVTGGSGSTVVRG